MGFRNEEFVEKGVISMTVSLKNEALFDKPNYEVTVCLISDQWGIPKFIYYYLLLIVPT